MHSSALESSNFLPDINSLRLVYRFRLLFQLCGGRRGRGRGSADPIRHSEKFQEEAVQNVARKSSIPEGNAQTKQEAKFSIFDEYGNWKVFFYANLSRDPQLQWKEADTMSRSSNLPPPMPPISPQTPKLRRVNSSTMSLHGRNRKKMLTVRYVLNGQSIKLIAFSWKSCMLRFRTASCT